jgi:2-polyprenyl-3-methyl-5-hydroxy-6-metoxy-1,4-benzoquinol methylase
VAPGSFLLYRCRYCRCIFQHPLPHTSAIRGFYPDSYWWAEEANPRGAIANLIGRLERTYREFVAADHARFLERCARGTKPGERDLLDLGCGSGLFLHLARRRGFLCHGMDASEHAIRAGREQYGLDLRQGSIGDDVWNGRRFDFVTMFHVLEHLTMPRQALLYVRSQLKPGGAVIIQVPNLASLQARAFKHRWYGLDVPRHIINYTPGALRLLLEEAGFVIERRARFSLRDNPASIASSLAPRLDPIARGAHSRKSTAVSNAACELTYFGLVILCLPLALLESAFDFGGTVWVLARLRAPAG